MPGKVFINYRRGPDSAAAGRLYDHLEKTVSADRLFIDIDDIPPGHDFVTELGRQVEACDVFISVVGRDWIEARDPAGLRRLDSPGDFVRVEIEAALRHGKTLIPVLVDDAAMPRPESLPESLAPFSRRNALRLTHARFRADAQGLIDTVQAALAAADERRAAQAQILAAQNAQLELTRAAEAERSAAEGREQARLTAGAGLSRADIEKAEELANWNFIKDSNSDIEYRDHMARFPAGTTYRMAFRQLEELVWVKSESSKDLDKLEAFRKEFPTGRYAEQADALIRARSREADERRRSDERASREQRAWDALEQCVDPEPFRRFLKDFPKSARFDDAWRRLSDITRKQLGKTR